MSRGDATRDVSRSPVTRVVTALTFASCILALGREGRAQSDAALASRQLLLGRAQQAQAAGHHAEALDLAQRAGAIQMTPSLRMFIAEEHEASGNLPAALVAGNACTRDAEATRDVRNSAAIASRCRELVQRVSARVGFVVVRFRGGPTNDLVVRVNGTVVEPALIGMPFVVAPGSVVVWVTASAEHSWRTDVRVGSGETRDVEVSVDDVRRSAAPGAGTSSTSRDAATGGPSGEGTTTSNDAGSAGSAGSAGRESAGSGAGSSARPLSPGPFVVLGAGAASFVAAAVFFAVREGALGACPAVSGRLACVDEASYQRASGAVGPNVGLNVSLVVGGLLAAGGIAWLVVDRVIPANPRRVAWSVSFTPGTAAFVSIGGAL